MNTLNQSNFFSRYLPMILAVVLIVGAAAAYFTLRNSTPTAQAGWYNSGWSYRKPITIDHTKVNTATGTTTPLSNFPVLISVTDPQLEYTTYGGDVASSTGADILFVSGDGVTLLNYEIENYSSSTGQLIAWVKIPSLSSTQDTTIYEYFGNANAPAETTGNKTGTWDTNYKAIWHFPNGSALSANDSTGVNNGTIHGTTATSGQIGGAANFASGSSQYISAGSNASLTDLATSTATYSFWINLPTTQDEMVLAKDNNGGNAGWAIDNVASTTPTLGSKGLRFIEYAGTTNMAAGIAPLNLNTWYYVVIVGDGSLTKANQKIYLNGVLQTLTASGNGSGTRSTDSGQTMYMGYNYPTTDVNVNLSTFNGSLDEVRLSNTARSADWIATEYNNQNSPATFYSYGSIGVQNRAATTPDIAYSNRGAGTSWYNASWLYRKPITIDHTKVNTATGTTTPLSNFPVLVSVTDPQLEYTSYGGDVASSTGADILFTDSSGTSLLNYEIENYSSSTGNLVAWVKIPSLSPTKDTTIYEYFDNANAPAETSGNITGTWDSNYKGIWHLPNGTVLTASDSTSNGVNGTSTNVSPIAGKIDGAGSFNGSNTQISMGDQAVDNVTNATVSAWVNATSYPNSFNAIVGKVQSSSPYFGYELRVDSGNLDFNIASGGSDYQVVSTAPTIGQFHYVVGTYDGTTMRLYIDGQQTSTTAISGSMATAVGSLLIGATNAFSGRNWNGIIDEVRISGIARSADWIATEYNNQNSPATFYAYGALAYNGRQTAAGSYGAAFNTPTNSATWTVPVGVNSITVKAWGGAGAGGAIVSGKNGGPGGAGGFVQGTLTVTPGSILNIYVGGAGSASSTLGGGGGGYSAVANSAGYLLIAGGGGGGGSADAAGPGSAGGAGGGSSGVAGTTAGGGATGGGAGTSSTVGTGGSTNGQNGTGSVGGVGSGGAGGGNGGSGGGGAGGINGGGAGGSGSSNSGGGGGGGGQFGGGGGGYSGSTGQGAGAGGGSGFATSTAANITLTAGSGTTTPDTTDPYYTGSTGIGGASGANGNNGYVIILYNTPPTSGAPAIKIRGGVKFH